MLFKLLKVLEGSTQPTILAEYSPWGPVVAISILSTFYVMQHSWKQFSYVRCLNTNRKTKGGIDNTPKSKRVKVESSEKHSYPPLTADPEDNVSDAQNVNAISKTKLNHEAIRELSKRTFHRRRLAILNDPSPRSVRDITDEYPALRKVSFVRNVVFICMWKLLMVHAHFRTLSCKDFCMGGNFVHVPDIPF